jgi:hypothetical protein
MKVNINGTAHDITLASGTDLDPRFVARDITYKLHSADTIDDFKYAQCEFRNGGGGTNSFNSFIIYSGQMGSNGAANDVNVTAPTAATRDCRAEIGFDTVSEAAGTDRPASTYVGSVTVSGVYGGQFDDHYRILINETETVGSVTAGGGNTYAGTATAGGLYTGTADDVYTVTVTVANGASMGNGSGSVPQFIVSDTPGGDDNGNLIELLYPNHWYDVGDLGVRISFTDAPFGEGDTFTINAYDATSGTGGAVATAKYVWSSSQEDSSKAAGIAPVTTQTTPTQVGTRGVSVAFSAGTFDGGETFGITCRGPQPTNTNVTQLNFGNVTVSTQSAVKVVWFELISGAVSMSTVKFSLQSDGTFAHHDQGNDDTEFHFGTVGAGNNAPGGGVLANDMFEFPVDSDGLGRIIASDIEDNVAPIYLYATKGNLAEVSSADDSESIGNYLGAVVSDFIYLAIKLGADETGANSTINYRMYFDFS